MSNFKRCCKKHDVLEHNHTDWPRLEPNGKHYNMDQYDVVPADEHGEVPPAYCLRQDAVSVEEQNATLPDSSQVMQDVLDFLSALWDKSMRVAGGDEARAEIIQNNILKLNGFPIGFIWPEAVTQAVRLGTGPLTDSDQALAMENEEILPDPTFLDTFLQLQAADKLTAIAGKPSAPMNNAGLYQGRIEQIDPVKWQSVRVHPLADSHRDHDMTNLMYPSLNEEEGEVQDQSGENDQPTQNPVQMAAPIGTGDKSKTPAVIVIVMTAQSSVPEPISFHMDMDGELHIAESKVDVSDWWKNLPVSQKRRYLETHPNSKYAKAYRKHLAAKKAASKRNAGKGAKAPKIVQELENDAQDSAQAIEDAGVQQQDVFPDELDNDQELQLDALVTHMDDAAQEQEQEGLDDDDKDQQNKGSTTAEPPSQPTMDTSAAKELNAASKKPGFFKSMISSVKQRASNGTLGAMGRFATGNMREGDKEKAIRGLTIAVGAMAVIGAGIGIAMIAGPGPLSSYIKMYVESMGNNAGGGGDFQFSGESSAAGDKPDEDAPISDEGLQKIAQGFLEWMAQKADEQEENEHKENVQ